MNEKKMVDFGTRIVEISQSDVQQLSQATNPNGRRFLKMVLHEIYPDTTQWNENGITYLEQYTRDNADTVKGMPLCAQFLDDDKETPFGHGMTGRINNMPVFENSIQVGCFEDWSIEELELEGRKRKCLCATGYLNEGRYPKFVKWVIDKYNKGEQIHGSVEFVGTKENDGEIIYDGGWKEQGRIPMVYDYSGYCILTVRPSDSAAVLVEMNNQVNNTKNINEERTSTMSIDELKAVISGLKDEIIESINKAKTEEVNSTVEELKAQIAELEKRIAELDDIVESENAEIDELNEKVKNAETCVVERETELNASLEAANSEKEAVVSELNELKKSNKISELNAALAGYSEAQRKYAESEIAAFNADPFSVEINSIVEKIDAASYREYVKREKEKKKAELNSKNDFDNIMANVDPIINDDKNVVDDFDVFA